MINVSDRAGSFKACVCTASSWRKKAYTQRQRAASQSAALALPRVMGGTLLRLRKYKCTICLERLRYGEEGGSLDGGKSSTR